MLGSNGSGKTTLLKVICGRLTPRSGRVEVFECKPGHNHPDIPGPGVGYMPQEIALFENFSIKQILTYYAMLYGMSGDAMDSRIKELSVLLRLPQVDRRVDRLSGGERRLVSLSAALIHSPKLLILDEPTVGVDPPIRHQIWGYLRELCLKNGCSLIIILC